MIDFTRAFSTAWDRMEIILFRPFDLGKWFTIGFGAFLAGFLSGGNGANGYDQFRRWPSIQNSGTTTPPEIEFHQIKTDLAHAFASWQLGMILVISLLVLVISFIVVLAIYWLGARGQFLLLDNIVRNRGAVSAPWQNYSRRANSLFLFYLLILLISLFIFLPILAMAGFMAYPYFLQERWPAGEEWLGFIGLGVVYLILGISANIILFIFREFSIPLMFRHGWTARTAFVEGMKLVQRHPGSVTLFVLLRIALAMAVWVMGALTCCCCVGFIPYLGTVALLPALIFVRCFTLDCLAQFGPEYDVWTVDVPPGGTAMPPTFSPPPRLG